MRAGTSATGAKTGKPPLSADATAGAVRPRRARDQDPAAIRYSFGGNAAQIPVTFLGNLIFVPVTLNGGTPGLFLVDTAAEHTTIEPIAGDPATSLSYVVLRMPGVAIPMPTLPVVAHPKFLEAFGDKVRGVLGRDVLSRMSDGAQLQAAKIVASSAIRLPSRTPARATRFLSRCLPQALLFARNSS